MKFTAKERVSLDLELENQEGEQRIFKTKEPVCATFIGKVNNERRNYFSMQEALPQKDKDLLIEGAMKMLTFVYDLRSEDIQWISDNFSADELQEIVKWVTEQTTVVLKK